MTIYDKLATAPVYNIPFPVGYAMEVHETRDLLREAMHRRHNQIVVAENASKVERFCLAPGVYNVEPMDTLDQWARYNGKAQYWHALLWHNRNHENEGVTKATGLKRLRARVKFIFERYPAIKLFEINELTGNAPTRTGLRESNPYMSLKGAPKEPWAVYEVLSLAAEYGRQIVFNDDGPDSNQAQRDNQNRILDEVDRLRLPWHGLGLQFHRSFNYHLWNDPWEAPKRVHDDAASRGKDFYITEADFSVYDDKGVPGSAASYEGDVPASVRATAVETARQFGKFCRDLSLNGRLKHVVFWNASIANSWLRYSPTYRVDEAGLFGYVSEPLPTYTAFMRAAAGLDAGPMALGIV